MKTMRFLTVRIPALGKLYFAILLILGGCSIENPYFCP